MPVLNASALFELKAIELTEDQKERLRDAANELLVASEKGIEDAREKRQRLEYGLAFGYAEGVRALAAILLDDPSVATAERL